MCACDGKVRKSFILCLYYVYSTTAATALYSRFQTMRFIIWQTVPEDPPPKAIPYEPNFRNAVRVSGLQRVSARKVRFPRRARANRETHIIY